MLIGLDGGATKFAAREVIVERNADGSGRLLSAGFDQAEVLTPIFDEPVDLEKQRSEENAPRISEREREMGFEWVDAAAKAISDVADGRTFIELGVCMPGIKTKDGRGISVLRNGPRMPYFAIQLESALQRQRVHIKKIPRLIGDGEACALGEKYGEGGHLRSTQNAYYLGCGTGAAEAFVVDGKVCALNTVGVLRAHELRNPRGIIFEDLVALKRMNERYEKSSGNTLGIPGDLERLAQEGDEHARRVLLEAAEGIVDLVLMREQAFSTMLKRPLQKVVLGQHTGRMYLDPAMKTIFADPLDQALVHRSLGNIVFGSDMRWAPILGAASTVL